MAHQPADDGDRAEDADDRRGVEAVDLELARRQQAQPGGHLIPDDCRGQHVRPGRPGLLADRERDGDETVLGCMVVLVCVSS